MTSESKSYQQGDWLFVRATKKETENIEEVIKERGILRDKPIQESLHIAEEAVELDHTFVRGKIKHRDYETIRIGLWRRAINRRDSCVRDNQ